MTKICKSCKKRETTEYEEIGLGQYCQECLDKEQKIWEKESGFYDEEEWENADDIKTKTNRISNQ